MPDFDSNNDNLVKILVPVDSDISSGRAAQAFAAALDLDVVDSSGAVFGNQVTADRTVLHAVNVVTGVDRYECQIADAAQGPHDVLGHVGTILKNGGNEGVVAKGELLQLFVIFFARCDGSLPLCVPRLPAFGFFFVLYCTTVSAR